MSVLILRNESIQRTAKYTFFPSGICLKKQQQDGQTISRELCRVLMFCAYIFVRSVSFKNIKKAKNHDFYYFQLETKLMLRKHLQNSQYLLYRHWIVIKCKRK